VRRGDDGNRAVTATARTTAIGVERWKDEFKAVWFLSIRSYGPPSFDGTRIVAAAARMR
jgi:hypothetical protein